MIRERLHAYKQNKENFLLMTHIAIYIFCGNALEIMLEDNCERSLNVLDNL